MSTYLHLIIYFNVFFLEEHAPLLGRHPCYMQTEIVSQPSIIATHRMVKELKTSAC